MPGWQPSERRERDASEWADDLIADAADEAR